MKVVINKCYGGFGLSNEAVEECIKRGMTVTEYGGDTGYINPKADFVKTTKALCNENYYCIDDDKNSLRTNPIVVSVVEDLGEVANGFCANLEVIDIPFDSNEGWYIDEYDGFESINENHRSW